MRWVAWDTETALIRPGVCAPELSCVQWCSTDDVTNEHPSQWPAWVVNWQEGLAWVRSWLSDPNVKLVGHNVAFDMGVVMANDPSLVPLVFQAYEQDRVTDTMLRQQLLDIAAGKFKGEFGSSGAWYRPKYGLGDVTKRLLGWQLEKPKTKKKGQPEPEEEVAEDDDDGEQEWRLKYGQLRDIHVSEWPAGAVKYALDDGRSTLGNCLVQEQHADWLDDQYRQARRALWLGLTKTWGLRTHQAGVEKFAVEVEQEIAGVKDELMAYGLVRKDGSRDTKAAAALMVQVCTEKRLGIVPTKTAEKRLKAGGDWDPTTLKGRSPGCGHVRAHGGPPPGALRQVWGAQSGPDQGPKDAPDGGGVPHPHSL
jgi:DNA polymerase-1